MEILTSLLAGGLTGLLGTVLTGGLKIFHKRQAHRQEIELRKIDLSMINAEAAAAERVAVIEAESEKAQAEYDALQASYKEAATRFTEGYRMSSAQVWVLLGIDVVRGLMRPALTLFLVISTTTIYFSLTGAMDLPAVEMQERIIATLLYLTTTCVTWWFGGRTVEKTMAK